MHVKVTYFCVINQFRELLDAKGEQSPQSSGRCASMYMYVLKLLYNKRSAYTERPAPSFVEERASILGHADIEERKNLTMNLKTRSQE
jgi:hypothetical protein